MARYLTTLSTIARMLVPLACVSIALLVLWYVLAVPLNQARATEVLNRTGAPWSSFDLIRKTWSITRPVLPTPDQVANELWRNTAQTPFSSRRNLLFHAWVTLKSAAIGLFLAFALGATLAVGITQARVFELTFMPWLIAWQTVPILATAPIIVTVLGSLGFTGIAPKAVLSGSIAFLPIAVGMVKGLRSAESLQHDLLATYNASRLQVFAKLRWPSSLALFFPGLKAAIGLALVGAIVAELPTGAQEGLGARLLVASYYGQMTQMWSILVVAALIAALAIGGVSAAEAILKIRRGGRL
jgi:NitT/TauT family transport system permease protein